ncbi:MAG: hypothetical protein GOMPHAMPRED_005511 [Gomphillus americanus]|uniref:Tyrosinase copper-binding domain-containing protein n=1 Tax=Gomphillus americanus TaxID=1940652 RepID=A0A8H3FYE1_9LECA|nr:MAG: hypothetical protein GOMPHAMPRED_005511 [Gomphillus americanus]
MLFFTGLIVVAAASPLLEQRSDPYASAKAALRQYQSTYEKNTLKSLSGSCKYPTVRKAWGNLAASEKKDYIKAVKCLAKTPTKLSLSKVPGARNQIDDFAWTHIENTDIIHVSAFLLPWHRHYIWLYEQTLRNDCGYKGSLPYWKWEHFADDQKVSPVFQAGDDSFGTNGVYVPHGAVTNTYVGLPAPGISSVRPPGNGGGCVTNGAFGNQTGWTLNLGPVSLNTTKNAANNTYGQQFNPRCLNRDFLQEISSENLNYTALVSLLSSPEMSIFHPQLELGVHRAAHTYIGTEAFDFFSSPLDPVFFLLHSQIDRIWAIWQGQDLATRQNAVDGTLTAFNLPPSANGTLQSVMHFGVLDSDKTIGFAASPTKNGYCYIYQ